MTELAKGTDIPEATLEGLYAWYQFRNVCDNERFAAYFNRQLRLSERQYLLLLRNDMTTWDPMVSDYMERLIEGNDTESSRTETSGETKTTRGGEITHSTSGQDVTDTEGSNHNTRTLGTKSETKGDVKASGSDVADDDTTRTDNLKHERNITDTRTDNLTTDSTSASLENGIGDTRHLEGATPDSSTYGTGSNIGLKAPAEGMPEVLHDTGAPDKLNWTYTGAQSEDIATEDKVSRSQDKTHNTGTQTTLGTGHTLDSGTVGTKGKRTTHYGRIDDTHTVTDESGTIGDEGGSNGKTTVNYGRILTEKDARNDTQTTTGGQDVTGSRSTTHKERYSGRHAAPTELLRQAQAYIVGSNSLKWLINQLETCFFQIYESW